MSRLNHHAANGGIVSTYSIPHFAGDAACAEIGGDEWFPEKGGSTRGAKKVCAGCEVRAQCLEWALDNGEAFGIWGGLSERQRRTMAQGRERKAPTPQPIKHGTESGYAAHRRRGERACGPCLDGNRLGIKVGAA